MIKHYIFVFGIILLSTVLLVANSVDKTTLTRRKTQSKDWLKENILRKKLEEITVKRVKVSKRIRMEKVFIQAGYDITYGDYIFLCIGSALLFSSIFRIVFSNVFLAAIFLVIGGLFPYQYILFKRNNRIDKMNMQIGPCLKMLIERYKTSKDMKRAIEGTALEFRGEQPLYHELERLVIEMNLGQGVEDAMDEFAERIGNPYMKRFVDYYRICAEVGTVQVRDMLGQALKQYQEDRKNKLLLRKEISSVKSESYIVLAGVPVVAGYQAIFGSGYVEFMTKTVIGQVGTAVVVLITLAALWVINKKIGAPIE